VSAGLDDFEARPGSAVSLLRTIIGAFLRARGGTITVARLVQLLESVGVEAGAARTAIARVKARGLLLAGQVEGGAGYRLNPAAVVMLERGDRRIFGYRQQGENDTWCVLSFTIPEEQRAVRHRLRQELRWIGCGTVNPGLWICPDALRDELEGILAGLGVRGAATLLTATRLDPPGSLREAASRWWDLDALAGRYRAFLEALPDALRSGTPMVPGAESAEDDRSAFARYTLALDRWRAIPYLDPGLPESMLPAGWPGRGARDAFSALEGGVRPAAERYALG
jgi:phenylacetic acid degradation operon negative regulatory protein